MMGQRQDVEPKSHAERIAALNSLELLLPHDYYWSSVVPTIAYTFLTLTTVYTLCFTIVDRVVPPGSTKRARRKASYQLTNLLVNTFLGLTGWYYEMYYVKTRRHDVSVEETVAGFGEFQIFASVQIGYQLWSIPVGILHVNENLPMLLHHFAVIAVASMSAFLTNGFRYWTPFFYGLVELSSVPLAILNTFKDNPDLVRRHSHVYTLVRVLFSLSFLWIRIVMFLPRKYQYLRDHYLLWSTHPNIFYQLAMAFCWISSFFLMTLQLYWAILIVRALHKLILKQKGTKEETTMNGDIKKIE